MSNATNSSISAGQAVSLTTATPANITSIVLSPGTYLVWGSIDATLAGATLTSLIASLSLTSATLSTQPGQMVPNVGRLFPEPIAQQLMNLVTATGATSLDVGVTVVTVPASNPPFTAPNPTTTLYLVGQATFSAGTVAAYGSLFACPMPN